MSKADHTLLDELTWQLSRFPFAAAIRVHGVWMSRAHSPRYGAAVAASACRRTESSMRYQERSARQPSCVAMNAGGKNESDGNGAHRAHCQHMIFANERFVTALHREINEMMKRRRREARGAE
jgi:hypothetical protein